MEAASSFPLLPQLAHVRRGSPRVLQDQGREVKDWPEEAYLGVGPKGFPPGPILFHGPAPLDTVISLPPFPSSK